MSDTKFTASEDDYLMDSDEIEYDSHNSFDELIENDAKYSVALELEKIQNQFPLWQTKEIAPNVEKTLDDDDDDDAVWPESFALRVHSEPDAEDCTDSDWNSKLEKTCRRTGNSYVEEVDRAIYGDTSGHPAYDSAEYFQAAQNYAIYGKDFLDFPDNLTPLLSDKVADPVPVDSPLIGNCGNGLYPTPAPLPTEVATGISFSGFGKQASATSYYQMCNASLQPTMRPAVACTTAYGMFLGNKVTYVAAAPTAPPLVYNQHSTTTTNFISNTLANAAALGPSPPILYSNPMLTTSTQQYLNTFLKETQYSAQGATTGIYERLIYAQMLQQQIYHQNQQQAAAVAAMFHKQTRAPAARPSTGGSGTAAISLNLCRQAAIANNSLTSPFTTPLGVAMPTSGGADDVSSSLLGD